MSLHPLCTSAVYSSTSLLTTASMKTRPSGRTEGPRGSDEEDEEEEGEDDDDDEEEEVEEEEEDERRVRCVFA